MWRGSGLGRFPLALLLLVSLRPAGGAHEPFGDVRRQLARQFGRKLGAEWIALAVAAHRAQLALIRRMDASAPWTGARGHVGDEFAPAVQDIQKVMWPARGDGLNRAEPDARLTRAAPLGGLDQIVERDSGIPRGRRQLQRVVRACLHAHVARGAPGHMKADAGRRFGNVGHLVDSAALAQVPERSESAGLVIAGQIEGAVAACAEQDAAW